MFLCPAFDLATNFDTSINSADSPSSRGSGLRSRISSMSFEGGTSDRKILVAVDFVCHRTARFYDICRTK